jgi:anti-sigma regulatory factor (Ser/Thr protein kinase)
MTETSSRRPLGDPSAANGAGARLARSSREFLPETTAVRDARQFATSSPAAAGVDLGALELAVSELASNAVLHAGTTFVVTVERLADGIRVSVTDCEGSVPRVRELNPESVTGRGLAIVRTLSRQFQIDQLDGGTTVWFELGWTTA